MVAAAPEVEWVIRSDVPVYDAHTLELRHPTTGKLVRVNVDEARLKRLADSANAKYARSGDESPITIGHTRDGAPETEQPPIVGYARDFYVAPRPSDGRPTMYARQWRLYPETTVGRERLSAEEVMRRWPRRSPEVWLGREDVDAVCLLGATTPARYLGLLRNSRTDLSTGTPMQDLPTFLAALQQLITQAGGGAALPPAAPAGGDPLQYEAGAGGGMPSATNTCPPSDDVVRNQRPAGVAQPAAGATPDADRIARDQTAIRLAQLETRDKARDAELGDLRLKYQRSVRERDLIQLEAEGYQFDRGEELTAVEALPDGQYDAYLKRVRARYQRVAGADGTFVRTARTVEGGGKPTATKDQATRAAEKSRASGKAYEECLAAELGAA